MTSTARLLVASPPADDPLGWPSDPPNVGVSDDTAADRERFQQILTAHVRYVVNIRRTLPDVRYVLLDLNAGCGGFIWSKRPEEPQLGTTLRAVRVLSDAFPGDDPAAEMGAIEQDPALAEHLRARLYEHWFMGDHCEPDVLEGRHEELAAGWVQQHMRGRVRGLIVHDPNAEMSRATLGTLGALRETRYVDFLLHVNGAIIKWHGTKQHPTVDETLALCGKRHAYIGPVTGNWQWAWLLLSNDDRISTAGDLARVDKPKGRDRLRTLLHTRAELKALRPLHVGQMGLFDGR